MKDEKMNEKKDQAPLARSSSFILHPSSLRLAFSSNAYQRFSIEDTIARIAGLGFAGLELLADVPHAWPAGLLPERKQAIRACLAEHGLAIANVNGFMMNAVADPRQPYWHPSWIEPDPHYRAIRREHTRRALLLAGELGAPTMQTEPGGPLATGESWHAAARLFYDELMPCVEVAEKSGVRLLIEPEPGLLIERFEQYLEFAAMVDSPWLGLNFDIGHAFCMGEDPQDWIARMAPHTRHYHIEDIGADRVHRHLIPGEGAIDFEATLREIARSGYDGWVTVELYPYVDDPDAAGRRAKQHLEAVWSRIEGKDEG
jgi:sugar phosphate isomerase/epimerase